MTLGGITPSEQYLARLCHRSFLSLWSFPNVFNDNGIVGGKGVGKEVCDLLVVFGNDIIIFSDKSCEYKDTGRLSVDWNRWYKKAVVKSVNQLYGAERWIKTYPDRIFLDPGCKKPFPIELPRPEKMRVHRIAIVLGAKEHCRAFYGGGSGSLRISTHISPIMQSDEEFLKAFTVGHYEEHKRYVHVFDDVSLDIVLRELDTISDFCAYLRKKEELINTGIVLAGGEEELLGLYLKKVDSDGYHGFGTDKNQYMGIFVPEGQWSELKSNPQYIAKKQIDKVSYTWDHLIEYFNQCQATGDIRESIDTKDYEKAIRHMAALNRVERRVIGQKLEEILLTTGPDDTRYSAFVAEKERKAFAFVLFPPRDDRSYDEYLAVRHELLTAYSNILKLKIPTLREAIGLALEPHKSGRGGSEDLAYFDYSHWSTEQKNQAKEDMKSLGIKAQGIHFSEDEYPVVEKGTSPLGNREARRKAAKSARRMKR